MHKKENYYYCSWQEDLEGMNPENWAPKEIIQHTEILPKPEHWLCALIQYCFYLQ